MARLLLTIVALIVIMLVEVIPKPSQSVIFLDIGQGDAILLQDGTRQVLIDGGQGNTVLTRLGEEMPWFDRTIEVVIATHPDQDHLEGLLHVLERYKVGLVLLPQKQHTSQLQSAWLDKLTTLLEKQEVAYRFGWRGQGLSLGEDVRIRLLGPFSEAGQVLAPGGKTNNAAILTRVDFKDLSLLLTSDVEAPIERRLVAQAGDMLNVDILKAGHHGSKTSTTNDLVAAASPSAVVISVGADNRYGHPHPTVVDRLKDIQTYRTDRDGSVRFTHMNTGWLLTTDRQVSLER